MRIVQRALCTCHVSSLSRESVRRKGLNCSDLGSLGYESKVNYHQSRDAAVINLVVQKHIANNRSHRMYRFHFGCNTNLDQFQNNMIVEHEISYNRDENILKTYTQRQAIHIHECLQDLKELN